MAKKREKNNGEQKASQLLAMAFRLWKAARCIYGKNELMLGCRRSIERVRKNSKLGYQGAQLMSWSKCKEEVEEEQRSLMCMGFRSSRTGSWGECSEESHCRLVVRENLPK